MSDRMHYVGALRFIVGRYVHIFHRGGPSCGSRNAIDRTLNPSRVTCKKCLGNMKRAGLIK